MEAYVHGVFPRFVDDLVKVLGGGVPKRSVTKPDVDGEHPMTIRKGCAV
ncbi:hypothetical protein ACFPWV_06775 [Streptomyces atrovirens]|uniref:Uncharacterized protein n=1 Tax=Streptomyces atrovirens TaxID=285556 RepID=A0ABW0DLB6_9ACTN